MSTTEGPSMTFGELKAYILSKMTMEQAFDRILESSIIKYQKLRFQEGEEIHPLIVMATAAMEMGWGFLLGPEEEVEGVVTGTEDYMTKVSGRL
jgi:hypothetical protein